MSSKEQGLIKKYKVEKIGKPAQEVDAIVLEFKDPIARVAIAAWASEMRANGYHECAMDTYEKLMRFERADNQASSRSMVLSRENIANAPR